MKIKNVIKHIVSIALAGSMFLASISFPELYAWAEDTEVTATAGWFDETAARLEISNQADMVAFYNSVNGGETFENVTVALTADIDMTTVSNFGSIGFLAISNLKVFSGIFEGNDYTITLSSKSVCGLFAFLSGAKIRNLTIAGNITTAQTSFGAFSANATNTSSLFNCTNNLNVICSGNNAVVSGFIAVAQKATALTGCINAGNITGTGTGACVAGFVSRIASNDITLTDCLNVGTITSTLNAGGFSAIYNSTSNRVNFLRCISAGSIVSSSLSSGGRNAGFAASVPYADFTDCLMLGSFSVNSSSPNGAFCTNDCNVTITNSYYNSDACLYGAKTTAADVLNGTYYACRKSLSDILYDGSSSAFSGDTWSFLGPVAISGTNLTECFIPLPKGLLNRTNFIGAVVDNEGKPVTNAVLVNDPSQITSENKTFILTGDISLSAPIESFSGTLYGCGHSVTLSLSDTETGGTPRDLGMFRALSGKVYDLVVTGTVTAGSDCVNVGAIAGSASNGAVISRCVNSVSFDAASAFTSGGFIGAASGNVRISDCANMSSGALAGFAGSIGATSTLSIDNSYLTAAYAKPFNNDIDGTSTINVTNCRCVGSADASVTITEAELKTAAIASTLGGCWTGSDGAYPLPNAFINSSGTSLSNVTAVDGRLSVNRTPGDIQFTDGNNIISSIFGLTVSTGSISGKCPTPGVTFESLDENVITLSEDTYTITGAGNARVRVSLPETASTSLNTQFIIVNVLPGTLTADLFQTAASVVYNAEPQCEIVSTNQVIEGLSYTYSADGVDFYTAEDFKTEFSSDFKNVNDPLTPYTVYFSAQKEGFEDYVSPAVNFNITKADPTFAFSSSLQELNFTGSPAVITAPVLTLLGTDSYASSEIIYSYKVGGIGAPINGLPTARGSYLITADYAGNGNYNAAQANVNLTVGYGTYGFTPHAYNAPYDGAFHSISFTGLPAGSSVTYSLEENGTYSGDIEDLNLKNVTSGAVTVYYKVINVDYNNGEAISGFSTVTITKADAVVKFSNRIQQADYNPSHPAAVTGAYTELQSGEIYDGAYDYRYRVMNGGTPVGDYINGLPRNAGTYRVYAKASDPDGNYNGVWSSDSDSVTLTINPIDGLDALVSSTDVTVTYDGEAHNIIVNAPENAVIRYSVDPLETRVYALALTGNINATAALENGYLVVYYKVTDSNYTDTVTGSQTLTIRKATPTLSFEQTEQTPVYTGSAAAVTAPVTNVVSGLPNSYAISYSYRPNGTTSWIDGKPTNVGTYTLRAALTFNNETPLNYSARTTYAFTTLRIAQKDYELQAVNVDCTYDGNPHNISILNVPSGTTLTYSTSPTGPYSANLSFTNAMDTTTVYYRASNPNYGGSLSSGSATIRIKKFTPSLSFTFDRTNPIYNGNPLNATATVGLTGGETYTGPVNYTYTKDGDPTVYSGLPTDAGDYTVVATIPSSANYELKTSTRTVTIARLSLGTITVAPCNFTYDTLAKVVPFIGIPSQGVNVTYSFTSGGEYTDMLFVDVMDQTVYYKITKIDTSDPNMENEATGSFRMVISQATPSFDNISTTDITYGEALSESTITGTVTIPFGDGTKTVTGVFTWNSGTTVPSVSDSDSTEYSLTFVPDDSTNIRSSTSLTSTLTVNPAPITIRIPSGQSTVYTGSAIVPSDLSGLVTDPSGVTSSYYYRIRGTYGDFTEGLPTNVGRYEIYAVINDENYLTVRSNMGILEVTNEYVSADDKTANTNVFGGACIEINAPENATITYSLNGVDFSDEAPHLTEESVNVIYYKAVFTTEGGVENTVYGNAVLTLVKLHITVTIIPSRPGSVIDIGAGETDSTDPATDTDDPGSETKPIPGKPTDEKPKPDEIIPADELEEIKNSGEDKEYDLGDGKKWVIHGDTVTDIKKKDLGFNVTSENPDIIPGLGKNDTVFCISFDEKGELGFTADIHFNVGENYNGFTGTVYTTDSAGNFKKLGTLTVNGATAVLSNVSSTLNNFYLVFAGANESASNNDPQTGVVLPVAAFIISCAALILSFSLRKRRS